MHAFWWHTPMQCQLHVRTHAVATAVAKAASFPIGTLCKPQYYQIQQQQQRCCVLQCLCYPAGKQPIIG